MTNHRVIHIVVLYLIQVLSAYYWIQINYEVRFLSIAILFFIPALSMYIAWNNIKSSNCFYSWFIVSIVLSAFMLLATLFTFNDSINWGFFFIPYVMVFNIICLIIQGLNALISIIFAVACPKEARK